MDLLLALKIGLFASAGMTMPLPYLSADVISPKEHRPGLELGAGFDLVKRDEPTWVNGQAGRRLVYMGATFAGLTWPINSETSIGVGVKYRPDDSNIGGYAGFSFRFRAIDWKQDKLNRG